MVFGAIAAAGVAYGAYSYYYTDTFSTINSANWYTNTTGGGFSGGANGLNGFGAVVSKVAVPGTQPTYYEVSSTLKLANSGGYYVQYLRASNDTIGGIQGSHYHVEIANPTFTGSGNTGTCSSSLNVYKRVNGVVTLLRSGAAPCRDGMVVRTMIVPLNGSPFLQTYIDNQLQYQLTLSSAELTTGQPGVGTWSTPAGSGISQVQLGQLDALPPPTFDPAQMSTMPLPTEIWFDWPGVLDDTNGTGVVKYDFFRASGGGGLAWIGSTSSPEFRDMGLSPSTAYTYRIFATDYHQNYNYFDLTINTAPAGAVSPRQIGLRPSTAFWGAEGEQIDMRSGNLNFTVPLVKAVGRGGSSAAFALNYNSQQWVYHSGRTWKFGKDLGYGFGWKFGLGSLTPVWSGAWALNSMIFTDASGTEYLLDQYSNGVFTSKDSYINYDLATNRVCFNDGICWQMWGVSGGSEADAGSYYPTRVVDTNGNQVNINYRTGVGAAYPNSSARIDSVEDVRAVGTPGGYRSYAFTYSTLGGLDHLTGISSDVGTGETYLLSYAALSPMVSPFSAEQFGATQKLQSLQHTGLGLSHSMVYSNSAEMTQLTLPLGAQLEWTHQEFAYAGSRKVREVTSRRQRAGAAYTQYSYNLTHPASDSSGSFHSNTVVADVTANSSKKYSYGTTAGANDFGRVNLYESFSGTAGTGNAPTSDAYTWVADGKGRLYVGTTISKVEPGTANEKISKVEQTLDDYGNLTQRRVYDYGNLATPAKVYDYAYLNGQAYLDKFIRNRVTSVTVRNGANTQSMGLVSNTYDAYTGLYTLVDRTGLREHDTANYGTSVTLRGNPTTQATAAQTSQFQYDITGMPARAWQNGVQVDITPAQNNTVPGAMTPNSNSSMTTSMSWNSFLGLTQVNGANGASSSIGYDQYARKTSTTSPTGATTSYSYTYNPATVTVSTTAPNLPATWAKSTQDGYGRTVKEEKGYTVSGVSTTESVVDTVYEPCGCTPIGKLKKVSRPYAPGGSASAWTVYNYDAMGRTVSVVAADGASTTIYEYVSNTVKTTDPAGKWKKYTLDGLGRLTQVNEPKPGGGSDLITNYDYDLLDKLKTVTMPRVMPSNATVTQTRSFVYNAAGQMTSMSIPEWGLTSANGTATYFWNGDKIGSKTDAKGQRIDYQYDSYRRLSNVRRYQTGGAEDALQRTDYYYDSNPYDGAYSQNAVGRLTAVHYWVKADPTAIPAKIHEFIEMFSYTPAGQPTKKKLVVIKTTNSVPYATSLEVQYTYDGEGKLISVKHPDHYNSGGTVVTGKTLTYDYTEMARLKSMKEGTTDWVAGVTYNIAGQMTAMNGETRTYNVMGQMISMGGMQYNYPGAGANNGRIVSQTLIDGESVSYQYDSLNRLSSATGNGWSQTYAYDGFGNMTDQNGTGSAPSMHLVIDPVKNGGGADANGNNGGEVDIENRLVGMAANARAGYDASNKRVWDKRGITGGSEERVYFFGVDGKRLGEFVMRDVTSGGTVIGLRMEGLKQNYYFGGRLLRQNDEQIRVDRLGNVVSRQVPGQSAQTFKYYPYGQEYAVTAHEKEKFGTYWRDSLSGMDYADQRYYNYLNGRFASPDRGPADVSIPQSWNRYAYAATDPINFNDPDGRLPANVSYGEDGFGCVASPFASSGGSVDASSPCPPGMRVVYSGPRQGSQTRTQQIAAAFDQLTGIVQDWDYADSSGRRFQVTFDPEFEGFLVANGFLGEAPPTVTLTPGGAIVITIGGILLDQLIKIFNQHGDEQRRIDQAFNEALRECKKEGKKVPRNLPEARGELGEAIEIWKRHEAEKIMGNPDNISFQTIKQLAKEILCGDQE